MTSRPRPPTSPGRSPFGPAAPSITLAVLFGIAALVWTVAGTSLPGGRWLAVHLFTLGVVTNLVLVFTEHFGHTLTRQPATPNRWQVVVVNLGIATVLAGRLSGARWATGVGATVVLGVVVASHRRLRRLRRRALGARFGWIVQQYERAHEAFALGAVLGLLLGLGVLSGPWYAAGRIAHLHVNVAGWAGLTLLATLVFFGPTIARTRIVEGADARAAAVLPGAAAALAVGTLLLVASGGPDPAATWVRIAAALAMTIYARAVTVVCAPVVVAARGAKPSAPRWLLIAVGTWFPAVAWADVAVIATGAWRWLDVVGLAAVLGVVGQSIVATLTYLAPMLRARRHGGRDRLLARLEVGATIRAAGLNLGALAVVAAAVLRGPSGSALATVGWALLAASLAWLLGVVVAPPGSTPGTAGD